jgi:hypothetical protein
LFHILPGRTWAGLRSDSTGCLRPTLVSHVIVDPGLKPSYSILITLNPDLKPGCVIVEASITGFKSGCDNYAVVNTDILFTLEVDLDPLRARVL